MERVLNLESANLALSLDTMMILSQIALSNYLLVSLHPCNFGLSIAMTLVTNTNATIKFISATGILLSMKGVIINDYIGWDNSYK